jgi:hypothetical protein
MTPSEFHFFVELEYLNEGVVSFSILSKNESISVHDILPSDEDASRKMKRKFRKLKRKAKKKVDDKSRLHRYSFFQEQLLVRNLVIQKMFDRIKSLEKEKK